MNDIDKWAAEKCGVRLLTEPGLDEPDTITLYWLYWVHNDNSYNFKWTIKDPRCREKVRERFKISTNYFVTSDKYESCSYELDGENTGYMGKTILKAEIACITAIHEQETQ